MDFKTSLTSTQKEKFRSVANKLLNECFLMKIKGHDNSDYSFFMEHRDLFIDHFDALGYEFNIDPVEHVVGLVNRNGTGRVRLKKIESIILLILRTLYVEKRKELSLTGDVIIEAISICRKYETIGFDKKLNMTTMFNALALLKKYNLIEILDDKTIKPETRIVIYPSISMAITYNSLESAYKMANDKLQEYKNQKNNKEDASDEKTDES